MNHLTRRHLLTGVPAMALTVVAPSVLRAQAYPPGDIHVICAFPAGSGADVLVRYFA